MKKKENLLKGSRVYLSGPMDFVASREKEKKYGWRNRITQFLRFHEVTVFDPWHKPSVRGLHEYGHEDVNTVKNREKWTYDSTQEGSEARSICAQNFWETMHIDLRMVDISDFIIAYVPTNIYSVGTVHEIIVAREQHKPVLFVSPPVTFPTLKEFEEKIKDKSDLSALLNKLKAELPIKENSNGIPSLWYMPLIGSDCFFNGFGFMNLEYRNKFKWENITDLDKREIRIPPKRPLLQFLDELAKGKVPKRWNYFTKRMEHDDDWLIFEESFL